MKKKITTEKKKIYIAPVMRVVEIEMEQNIFAGSAGGNSDLNGTDMGAEDWW